MGVGAVHCSSGVAVVTVAMVVGCWVWITGMWGGRAVRGMAARNGVTEGKFRVATNCPSKRRDCGKGYK